MSHTRRAALLAAPLLLAGLTGCAGLVQPVQPWEKATLGHETMKATGPVPAYARIDGHIYYSKEAVRGGTGVGGGGCGCN